MGIVKGQVKPSSTSLPGASVIATAPSAYLAGAPVNYIRSLQPIRPLTLESTVLTDDNTQVRRSTQYIDGLGRLIQTVNKGAGPSGNDIVSPIVYDAFGRESYQYLPYVSTNTDGSFKQNPFGDQSNFYTNTYPTTQSALAGEQVFYNQTNYEASPLNRVLKTLAPGNSWAGNNRGLSISYETNISNEVRIWDIGPGIGSVPSSSGYYTAGEIYRTISTDEHGKRVVEYKDKDGRVILKKIEITQSSAADIANHDGWLCTYRIYDDLNNLRYVIQPKGTEVLEAASWSFDANNWSASNIAKELCFSYEYDERNRVVIKRVPGSAEAYMVYDVRDRLVLMQDGNLRTNGQWVAIQYDILNRQTKTYLWNNTTSHADHRIAAWSSTSYPTVSGAYDLLTVTHYDDYNWVTVEGGGLSSSFSASETASGFLAASDVTVPYARNITTSYAVKGMVTGTQIKVLGTGTYLYAVNFYDDRGRLIQVQSKNMSGATDVMTTQYSFDGKVLAVKQNHNAIGMTPGNVVTITKNNYDHVNRLLSVTKQVDGGDIVTIAENEYDALGQLKTKKLGRQKPGGVYSNDPIETLTYDYNIRGWLMGINKDYAIDPAGIANYFGEKLHYDYGFTASQYNGNIAGITWASANDQQPRAYGYTYDPANRLLKADFTEKNGGNWDTNQGRDYTTVMGNGISPTEAYDANGNIKKMSHYISAGTAIDVLTYNYGFTIEGNKLKAIKDDGNNSNPALGDFKEITYNQSQDYDYDLNGNLILDNNKGISSINYNYLNLPSSITVTGKGTIAYIYDAVGNKLQKIVTDATNSNTVTTTTYIGEFQYENGDLKQFAHEEGRVRRKPDDTYVYDYYVRDHLGSVRVTLTEEETTQAYRMATMELDSAQQEETYYANITETRSLKPAAYPDRDSTNKYVARIDGRQRKAGPSILLKVSAGDKINIQARSWYKYNGRKSNLRKQTLAHQAAGLAGDGALGIAHNTSGIRNTGGNALMPALMSFLSSRDGSSQQLNRKPKAYLNWVLLDEDLKPFKEDTAKSVLMKAEYAGFQQVGEEEELKQHVKENWKIEKSGYVYVFTSNESEDADVIFEDFGIMSVQGPLLEVNHTYPFGVTMAGISSKAVGKLQNRYQFNGGNELQSGEFSDGTGLDLYDAEFRMYDPQIGRFFQQDMLAGFFEGESPYNFVGNNPILLVDPYGLAGDTINAKKPLQDVVVTSSPRQVKQSVTANNGLAGALPLFPSRPTLYPVPPPSAPIPLAPVIDIATGTAVEEAAVTIETIIETSTVTAVSPVGLLIIGVLLPTSTGAGADQMPLPVPEWSPFPGHGNNRNNSNPHIVYEFNYMPTDGRTNVLKYGISDQYRNGLDRPESQLPMLKAMYGASVKYAIRAKNINRIVAALIEQNLVTSHYKQWTTMPREQTLPRPLP
jgi:RHS repeat-associated protein